MSTPACPTAPAKTSTPDGAKYVCADCGFEWPMDAAPAAGEDADGNVLIKDLKVKDSSITLKVDTKVKSIRLAGRDHEVDCKMDAGNFMLKACYLKKV